MQRREDRTGSTNHCSKPAPVPRLRSGFRCAHSMRKLSNLYMLRLLFCSYEILHDKIFFIIQVDSPLSKMLGSRSIWIFKCFWILEYLHVYNDISGGWDPDLNTEFIYVSPAPSTSRLRWSFTISLFVSYFACVLLHESDVEFSASCGVRVSAQMASSSGVFLTLGFQI